MARETFTSLKATHYAHRMAGDILYSHPLNLNDLACPVCRHEFKLFFDEQKYPFCQHCGVRFTNLPPHLIAEQQRQEATARESELIQIECEQRELQRSLAQAEQDTRRMTLVLICLASIIIAILAVVRLMSVIPYR